MSHCPQCGSNVGEGAVACPMCGVTLSAAGASPAPRASARTMVGVSAQELGLAPQARPVASRTIVGMPESFDAPAGAPAPVEKNPSISEASSEAAPRAASRTIVGMAVPAALAGAASPAGRDATSRTLLGGVGPIAITELSPEASPVGMPTSSRTMIGVAMPGIAPVHPTASSAPPAPIAPHPQGARILPQANELGATLGSLAPQAGPRRSAPPELGPLPSARRDRPTPARRTGSRRATVVIVAACLLAIVAVLFGLFWKGAPPITARAKIDAQGREVLEVRCPGCVDGTVVHVRGGDGTMAAHTADVPLATPLAVGENQLSVAVDRPAQGRDEVLQVQVDVAYRIRPDLGTLQADRPSIQIAVEAVDGTTVALDGKPVTLVKGQATQTIDVLAECTGLADDPTTIRRQIPYAVTTRDGATEHGTVDVSVGVLPLHLDAPGPHAVTDGKSFVLAGRTLKGADVLAAGRPIPVGPDGSFVQVMNISSVGATQIEVRAKMAGMAPRRTEIAVQRVDSLETAAVDFAKQPRATWADVAGSIAAQIGKPVVLAGEVVEARTSNHQTVILLDVSRASGCTAAKDASTDACRARLVQGGGAAVKRGDLVTAYGAVARAFKAQGHADIPEVQVDFLLKGLR